MSRRDWCKWALIAGAGAILGTAPWQQTAWADESEESDLQQDGASETQDARWCRWDASGAPYDDDLKNIMSAMMSLGLDKSALTAYLVVCMREMSQHDHGLMQVDLDGAQLDDPSTLAMQDNQWWVSQSVSHWDDKHDLAIGFMGWSWASGDARGVYELASQMSLPWQAAPVQMWEMFEYLLSVSEMSWYEPHTVEEWLDAWYLGPLSHCFPEYGESAYHPMMLQWSWVDPCETFMQGVEPHPGLHSVDDVLAYLSGDGDQSYVEPPKRWEPSMIAQAAVAIAYNPQNLSDTENCTVSGSCGSHTATVAYRAAHNECLPRDSWWASCDRGASTAVRLSGADDNFAFSGCSSIMSHMDRSSHWQKVDGLRSLWHSGELQPGDICVCPGHVFVYTGNDIVAEKFPSLAGTGINTVHASQGDYCPMVKKIDWYLSESRTYSVYRCVQHEESSVHADLAAQLI